MIAAGFRALLAVVSVSGISAAWAAYPPDTSPEPRPRPFFAASDDDAGAPGMTRSILPRQRPSFVHASLPDTVKPTRAAKFLHPPSRAVPVEAGARTTRLILPAAARTAPPVKPDGLGDTQLVVAAFVPIKPFESITTGRTGALCGTTEITGRTLPPIAATLKGCGIKDAVEITSVSGVRMSAPVITDCPTATSLAMWLDKAVKPAVQRRGGGVRELQIAASYVCRPRNNQKGNRISEHGKGRAVDVSAIVLADGTAIDVQRDWGKGRAGAILKKVRADACGPFSTVLGPGSDKFHRDHLHLDTARGRGAWCR